MVDISLPEKHLCVDAYEAAPGESCRVQKITNAVDTRAALDEGSCIPATRQDVQPWTYVTFHQAKELCAKAGKRLPTNEEWYAFSLGTSDDERLCNTSSQGLWQNSSKSTCKNAFGLYNAIGNAWEWVDGTVSNGMYKDMHIPQSGYVVSANASGIATLTDQEKPNPDFHNDYFWSDPQGEYGMLRGGFYGSHSDAGIYSVQAKTLRTFASDAVGFRCVKTLAP
jgi:formylglycine-generating enzyme required for sulfatase activity